MSVDVAVPGFAAEEIRTDQPTRAARLKWVTVLDASLAPGLLVNAAACMAAAVGERVAGLLGPAGVDAAGRAHVGLPWPGCSILTADADALRALRDRAAGKDGVLVVDMPEPAQTSRVYDEYLARLADLAADDLRYYGLSLVGPRNRIDKLVGRLPLL